MPVKRERMVYWEEGASVPKSLPVPQAMGPFCWVGLGSKMHGCGCQKP